MLEGLPMTNSDHTTMQSHRRSTEQLRKYCAVNHFPVFVISKGRIVYKVYLLCVKSHPAFGALNASRLRRMNLLGTRRIMWSK